jgi:hypothetical protein
MFLLFFVFFFLFGFLLSLFTNLYGLRLKFHNTGSVLDYFIEYRSCENLEEAKEHEHFAKGNVGFEHIRSCFQQGLVNSDSGGVAEPKDDVHYFVGLVGKNCSV